MAKKPFKYNELSNVKCDGPHKTMGTKNAGCSKGNFLKKNLLARKPTADRCYHCYNIDHPQEGRVGKRAAAGN